MYTWDPVHTTFPRGQPINPPSSGLAPTYHTTNPMAAVPCASQIKGRGGGLAGQRDAEGALTGAARLKYSGRKPAWDARPEPRYWLPGYTAEGIGEVLDELCDVCRGCACAPRGHR